MLFLITLIVFMACLWGWFNKRRTQWLKHGKFYRSANLTINQNSYYMEEVKCESYQHAFGTYDKIIDEIRDYGKIIDIKYDLYDWTFAYFKFEDITIGIKHYRPLNRIQLVQSKSSITIDAMEIDNTLSSD